MKLFAFCGFSYLLIALVSAGGNFYAELAAQGVDPNAAAAADQAPAIIQQARNEDGIGNYQFAYQAQGGTGRQGHQESGDEYGRKQGSYSLGVIDGRERVVNYVADEFGYRANIQTNEPGTAPLNPADVTIQAPDTTGIAAITGEQTARQLNALATAPPDLSALQYGAGLGIRGVGIAGGLRGVGLGAGLGAVGGRYAGVGLRGGVLGGLGAIGGLGISRYAGVAGIPAPIAAPIAAPVAAPIAPIAPIGPVAGPIAAPVGLGLGSIGAYRSYAGGLNGLAGLGGLGSYYGVGLGGGLGAGLGAGLGRLNVGSYRAAYGGSGLLGLGGYGGLYGAGVNGLGLGRLSGAGLYGGGYRSGLYGAGLGGLGYGGNLAGIGYGNIGVPSSYGGVISHTVAAPIGGLAGGIKGYKKK